MASEFFAIGKIFETVPTFYKCADGMLSTHNGRGACMYHGGLSSAKAIKLRRRCKTIAVVTPKKQVDLFRKDLQGDLFENVLKIGDWFANKKYQNSFIQIEAITKEVQIRFYEYNLGKLQKGSAGFVPIEKANNFVKNGHWISIGKPLDIDPTYKPFKRTVPKKGTPAAAEPQQNTAIASEFVPIKWIGTNKRFQNRESDFSTRSVTNIIEAVKDGSFRWSNLDPIILWQPNRAVEELKVFEKERPRYYVLSGHSRLEAFRRLYDMQATAQGRDFGYIPAKIEVGISFEETQKIALNSNTLSTKETDIERAAYYRTLR